MKHRPGTYARRGEIERRRTRIRRTVLALGFFSTLAFLLGNREPMTRDAAAASSISPRTFRITLSSNKSLESELDSAQGELALAHIQLDHANAVISYSMRYGIDARLSANVLDVARAEGIDPDLAFRLVRLESDFNARATSPVGAIGLTQVMPSTARLYDRRITVERLYDQRVNLRIGMRYLRELVDEYHGDMKLALLVYNRGPAAVAKSRSMGDNPSNGYDRILTKGYRGHGVVE